MHWSRCVSCTDHMTAHELITWILYTDQVTNHALITWLTMHWSRGYHALITCLIMHWSRAWSCTDHEADHTSITWVCMLKSLPKPWVRKMPWERKWQPTPVFLPGESHGQRSLAGHSPWGCKRVRHNLVSKQQQTVISTYIQQWSWVAVRETTWPKRPLSRRILTADLPSLKLDVLLPTSGLSLHPGF